MPFLRMNHRDAMFRNPRHIKLSTTFLIYLSRIIESPRRNPFDVRAFKNSLPLFAGTLGGDVKRCKRRRCRRVYLLHRQNLEISRRARPRKFTITRGISAYPASMSRCVPVIVRETRRGLDTIGAYVLASSRHFILNSSGSWISEQS